MFTRLSWFSGLLIVMLLVVGAQTGYARQDTVSTEDVEFTPMSDSADAAVADPVVRHVSDTIMPVQAVVKSAGPSTPQTLPAIFIAGLLGGFAAVLMPCIFPMLPMTVSFFTK